MTRKTALLIFCLFGAVAAFAGSGPVIECDAPVFDFGNRSSSYTVRHTFIVRNTGDANLTINPGKPCCGMTVTVSSKVIEPGKTAEVKVKVSLSKQNGAVLKNIYLINNSKNDPYLHLQLKGFCK